MDSNEWKRMETERMALFSLLMEKYKCVLKRVLSFLRMLSLFFFFSHNNCSNSFGSGFTTQSEQRGIHATYCWYGILFTCGKYVIRIQRICLSSLKLVANTLTYTHTHRATWKAYHINKPHFDRVEHISSTIGSSRKNALWTLVWFSLAKKMWPDVKTDITA